MQVNKLLASKTWQKLPEFIRVHKVFQNIKRIDKPFPKMGLPNCLERCPVDFDGKPAYIGFTSSGITGLWDLATMSMRGVCSCMHWDNIHAHHLIGSITDPFLGMVYISDNTKTRYGLSIKRRSLVRLVYNDNAKKYKLLLDRVYKDTGNTVPTIYNNRDPDEYNVFQVFKQFLSDKTQNTYEVITPREREYNSRYGYCEFIPKPTSLDHIQNTQWSLIDCGSVYNRLDDSFAAKFANQD